MSLHAYNRALTMCKEVLHDLLHPEQISSQAENEPLTSPNDITTHALSIITSTDLYPSSDAATKLIQNRKHYPAFGNRANSCSDLNQKTDYLIKKIYEDKNDILPLLLALSKEDASVLISVLDAYEKIEGKLPVIRPQIMVDLPVTQSQIDCKSVADAMQKGNSYLLDGHFDIAKQYYNRAISIAKNSSITKNGTAGQDIKELLEDAKNSTICWEAEAFLGIVEIRMGTFYLLNGHFDMAKKCYHDVIRNAKDVAIQQEAGSLSKITNRLYGAYRRSLSESTTNNIGLLPAIPLSPLAQLKAWTAKSTPSSEPLRIEGGIPQVTILVDFSSKRILKIPPNIDTREKFILWLAKEAGVNDLLAIEKMFKSGKIYANIQPINTDPKKLPTDVDPEIKDFFEKFIHNPCSPYTPAFVRPVSDTSIAFFKAQNPQLMWTASSTSSFSSTSSTLVDSTITRSTSSFSSTSSTLDDSIITSLTSSRSRASSILVDSTITHSTSSFSSTNSTLDDSIIIPATRAPFKERNESKEPLREGTSPEPMISKMDLFSTNPLSPLAQLRAWAAKSTVSSESFEIEGGIPQITFSVRFFLGSKGKKGIEIVLTTPFNMKTREDFLLFLAKNADIEPDDIVFMLQTGIIYANIRVINADPEIEAFFKEFIYNPYEFQCQPTPYYVKPVSDEKIAAFKAQFPATFDTEYFEKNPCLPQIDISVKFPQFPETKLTTPPNIEKIEDFLLLLIESVPMRQSDKERIRNTGEMVGSVRPIDADRASVVFFEKFLTNRATYLPITPTLVTICVKFSFSKPLILKVSHTIRSHKEFMQFLGRVAVNVEMPSNIKTDLFKSGEIRVDVSLIDTDSKSEKFFKRLCNHQNYFSIPIDFVETTSVVPLSLSSISSQTSSIPTSLSSSRITTTNITPLMFRSSAAIPSVPQRSMFYSKSESLSSTPIVDSLFPRIHVVSPVNAGLPTVNTQMIIGDKIYPCFLKTYPLVSDLTLTTELSGSPQRLIEIALPWTSSASDRDFSKCYHTVKIPLEMRSLDELKLHLRKKIPALGAIYNSVDFDVMCSMGNVWSSIDNIDALMAYFKQIEKSSIPFFACVERKLPKPNLSKQQSPALRQPEPEPLLTISSLNELKRGLETKIPDLATKLANSQIECTVGSVTFTINSIDALMPYFQQIQHYRIPFFVRVKNEPPENESPEMEISYAEPIVKIPSEISSLDEFKQFLKTNKPALVANFANFDVMRMVGDTNLKVNNIEELRSRNLNTESGVFTIPPGFSSLEEFKQFIKTEKPALVADLADFEIVCVVDDTTFKVDSIEELMSYHKVIQEYCTPYFACIEGELPKPDLSKPRSPLMVSKYPPFFACVERKPPEPDLSRLQRPLVERDPEPFLNAPTFYCPVFTREKFVKHKIEERKAKIRDVFRRQQLASDYRHQQPIRRLAREFERQRATVSGKSLINGGKKLKYPL